MKRKEPFWRYFAALVLICTIVDLYLIAGMDAQERKQRDYAEFLKEVRQMYAVGQEAGGRARAIKEVGDESR